MDWNPYHEAAVHTLLVLGSLGFMLSRIWRPVVPAATPRVDHGQWILPVGVLIALCLLRLLYLIDSKQILGYPT